MGRREPGCQTWLGRRREAREGRIESRRPGSGSQPSWRRWPSSRIGRCARSSSSTPSRPSGLAAAKCAPRVATRALQPRWEQRCLELPGALRNCPSRAPSHRASPQNCRGPRRIAPLPAQCEYRVLPWYPCPVRGRSLQLPSCLWCPPCEREIPVPGFAVRDLVIEDSCCVTVGLGCSLRDGLAFSSLPGCSAHAMPWFREGIRCARRSVDRSAI